MWLFRGFAMSGAADHWPEAESKVSQLWRRLNVLEIPPQTRTLPLGSKVAVCAQRVLIMEPVALHWSTLGS